MADSEYDYEESPAPVPFMSAGDISSLYTKILGREASPEEIVNWTDSVSKGYVNPQSISDQFYRSPEYLSKNQPYLDPAAGTTQKFESGVNYYDTQGLTRAGAYEGLPTAYYDKDGKIVAWFGTKGVDYRSDPSKAPEGSPVFYRPNQTEDYTWHTAKELENDPYAIPSFARENADQWGRLGGGQWIAPAAMAAALAGAAYLGPLIAGEAAAAGAGAGAAATPLELGGVLTATELGAPIGTGSLTAGITPGSVAAFEAGLPATMGEIGGLAGAGAGGMSAAEALTAAADAGGLGGEFGVQGALGGTGAGLGGLSGSQLFQAARMALPALGSAFGGTRAGSGQGGQGGQGGTTTQVSANGPWNTFLNPTMIRQDIVEQKPIMNNPELATIYGQLDPYLGNQLAQAGMIPANLGGGSTIANVPSVNYYSYGSAPQTDLSSYGQSLLGGAPLMAAKGGQIGDEKFRKTALGGNTQALFEQAKSLMNPSADVGALAGFSDGGDAHVPEFITGATGHYVKGRGDGQSDDIPAMLADSEYVFDADTVAALGNGSSDAGAKFLDKFREAIREHKRSAPTDKIPPKASPLQYVKQAMQEMKS